MNFRAKINDFFDFEINNFCYVEFLNFSAKKWLKGEFLTFWFKCEFLTFWSKMWFLDQCALHSTFCFQYIFIGFLTWRKGQKQAICKYSAPRSILDFLADLYLTLDTLYPSIWQIEKTTMHTHSEQKWLNFSDFENYSKNLIFTQCDRAKLRQNICILAPKISIRFLAIFGAKIQTFEN